MFALLRRQPCTWAWEAYRRLSSLFSALRPHGCQRNNSPLHRGRQRPLRAPFRWRRSPATANLKLALLLAAGESRLGGVARAGGARHRKSVLALLHALCRADRTWLDLAKPASPNVDPLRPRRLGWAGGAPRNHRNWGGTPAAADPTALLPTAVIPARFIQGAPWASTEDRLVGSVDVTASLAAGAAVFQPACWPEPHRGVLYVAELNLLDDGIHQLLLAAVGSGEKPDRAGEGLASPTPAAPCLIATYNPKKGAVRDTCSIASAIVLSANQLLRWISGWGSPAPAARPRPAFQRSLRARWQEETDAWPPSCCWPPVAPDVVNCPRADRLSGEGGPCARPWKPPLELTPVRVARPLRPCAPAA